ERVRRECDGGEAEDGGIHDSSERRTDRARRLLHDGLLCTPGGGACSGGKPRGAPERKETAGEGGGSGIRARTLAKGRERAPKVRPLALFVGRRSQATRLSGPLKGCRARQAAKERPTGCCAAG